MIGALVSAALSIGSAIYGGIKSKQAAEKAQAEQAELTKKQKGENQAWYDRRYNEDATQRADAQRLLAITRENIRQRNRAAQGRAAVAGATEESVAAEKEANNKALSDAVGQIAANNAARKDAIEQQYRSNNSMLDNRQAAADIQAEQARSQAVANATAQAGQALGNLGTSVDAAVDANKAAKGNNGAAAANGTTGATGNGFNANLGVNSGSLLDEAWKARYKDVW